MLSNLFAKKSIEHAIAEADGAGEQPKLNRTLGPWALTALGIGCIIGTGIFVLTGVVAHDKAGPALMLSFASAGITCIFAALCYAEFASMVPIAGSAYTYAYVTLGELFAWIIGWDLILEYSVAAATVAHGWSHYFQDFIGILGIKLPHAFTNSPLEHDINTGELITTGTLIDLPALVITAVIAIILIKGIRESARFNNAMVFIKLAVVFFVIAVGAFYVVPANWKPFAPFGYAGLSFFGHTVVGQTTPGGSPVGMLAGAAMIFFAYIGFDAVSTQAEEAKNPQRDIPIGLIASLVICTLLYIAVSAVITGMVPYHQINIDAPVSDAFARVGLPWAQFLVSAGALAGITSVLLVLMMGQSRIKLAMARDGLIPARFFAAIHPRFRTPWKSTITTGVLVGALAALLPLRLLAELVNIGTLLAFVLVCAAVIVLRKTRPDLHRPFRVPFGPVIPILGIISCLVLMFSLPAQNWVRLGAWLLVGLVIYFGYSRRHVKR